MNKYTQVEKMIIKRDARQNTLNEIDPEMYNRKKTCENIV